MIFPQTQMGDPANKSNCNELPLDIDRLDTRIYKYIELASQCPKPTEDKVHIVILPSKSCVPQSIRVRHSWPALYDPEHQTPNLPACVYGAQDLLKL